MRWSALILLALASCVSVDNGRPARSLDVTEFKVVGQGCGTGEQRSRVYVAVEEDDLPGPDCEVVFEFVERDFN
jgi:hypothetical protein